MKTSYSRIVAFHLISATLAVATLANYSSFARADWPDSSVAMSPWVASAYSQSHGACGGEVDAVAAMGDIRGHVCGDCCDEAPVCDDCCCEECCCPCVCWYAETDGLVLNRSKPDRRKIVENGTGPPPRGERITVMTTDALDFDEEWGPRIVIGAATECHDCEMIYYGFHHWQTSATATMGNPEVDVPFLGADFSINGVLRPISDFDGAQSVTAIYASELHNFEANHWFTNGRTLQPLLGFRYFDLDEDFDLRATDTGDTSDYLIDANNHLVGIQTGLRYDRQACPRFNWNVLGKAGVYANFVSQDTLLRDDNNTVLIRDFTNRQEDVAFIAEFGVNLRYAITRRIELTGGYLLVFVDGLALAPEQLDFSTSATAGSGLNSDGDLFLNGGYAGVRITF